ncbi:Serine/threonine-protein phosphatase [Drechslerella dactyloides]|uniref:Serine/threonine-protein phosphatase n=1 Tax=Drechslerella dactyloides TaxID=74499 RepID=A0AAD6J2V5_DREDA|nr:Serine/threonine-protein phosphatase [Drechslerella dactyloides]
MAQASGGLLKKARKGPERATTDEYDGIELEDGGGITIKVLEIKDETSSSSWEKAKVLFREKLQLEEGSLDKKTLQFLNEVVTPQQAIAQCEKTKDRADREYSSKKEVVVAGVKLNLKEKMAKILRKMNMFLAIGDVIFQNSPDTSAVVWSAVRLILERDGHTGAYTIFSYSQIALDDINTCGLLIDAVDEITGAMFAAEIYERRYQKAIHGDSDKANILNMNNLTSLGGKVLEKIAPLYADILYFSYSSKKYLQHGKMTRLMKGFTKPIIVLQGILDGITKKLTDMHTIAGLVFQEQSLDSYEELAIMTKTQGEETRTFIKEAMFQSNRDVTDLKDSILRKLETDQKEKLQADFADNEKWLDPLHDLSFELNSNRAKRQKGTCGWIFNEENYQTWYKPSESSFLWIYGKPGFGKSVIMSAIVDNIIEDTKKSLPHTESDDASTQPPPPLIAFFFCKIGNEKTQRTVSVVKNLIYQFYSHCKRWMSEDALAEANKKVKEVIEQSSQVVNLKQSSNSADTLPESLYKLLLWFAKFIDVHTYMVIDAIDEFDSGERGGLLKFLQQITTSDSKIRVVVASREEPDILSSLSQQPKISVEEQKNSSDVKIYVKQELQKISILKEKERLDARKVIVKRAAGMFRYAALAIQSLREPWSRPLSKHLKNLPDQMTEFYQRSLAHMNERQKEVLITALRWIICADEEIYLQDIAEDYSCVFLDAPEEEDQLSIESGDSELDDVSDDISDDSDEEDRDEDDDDSVDGGDGGDDEEGDVDGSKNGERRETTKSDGEEKQSKNAESRHTDSDAGGGHINSQQYNEEELRKRLKQAMEHVANVRSIFFTIGEDEIVRLTHTTVNDFVESSAKQFLEETAKVTTCKKCLQDLEKSSTVRCAPKWGHLLIALTITRHLNSPEFQQRYMSWDFWWDKWDMSRDDARRLLQTASVTASSVTASSVTAPSVAASDTEEVPDTLDQVQDDDSNVPSGDAKESEAIIQPSSKQEAEGHSNFKTDPLTIPEGTTPETSVNGNNNVPDVGSTQGIEAGDKAIDGEPDDDSHSKINGVGAQSNSDSTAEAPDIVSYAASEVDTDYAPSDPGAPPGPGVDEASFAVGHFIRYEIKHWLDHLSKAEVLWTDEEKRTTKEWQDLIQGIKQIVNNKKVFRFLQRQSWARSKRWGLWNHNTGYMWTLTTGYADPLCVFASCKVPTLLAEYLKDGADPNVKFVGRYGMNRTALQFAAENEDPRMMKLLLEAGADLEWCEYDPRRKRNTKTIDYTCQGSIIYLETMRLYLEHGGDAVLADREHVCATPLHYAAVNRNVEAVKLLLQHGARVNAKDDISETPLHYAFDTKGHDPVASKKVIALLLEHGAGVNEVDDDGQVPLYEAALLGDVELLELLLEHGADLHTVDNRGETPLHAAAMSGHTAACLLLIDKGVDIMRKDHSNQTALFNTVYTGFPSTFKALLPLYLQKDPTHEFLLWPDKKGRIMLHRAAANGQLDIVKELLSIGDPLPALKARERGGSTPLFAAAYRGFPDVVEYLISKGSEVDVKDKHGASPLSRAIDAFWSLDNQVLKITREKTIALLIRANSSESKVDYSLTRLSSLIGSTHILDCLIDIGMDFLAVDDFGWTWAEFNISYGLDREYFLERNIAVPEYETSPTSTERWLPLRPSRPVSLPRPELYKIDEGDGTIINWFGDVDLAFATDMPIPLIHLIQTPYYYEMEIMEYDFSW